MMASPRQPLAAALRLIRPSPRSQWLPLEQRFCAIRPQDSCCNGQRHLTTVSRPPPNDQLLKLEQAAIKAAPEIDLAQPRKSIKNMAAVRYVPATPSYFSRTPVFNDSLLALEKLLRSYGNLPTLPPSDVERVAWKSSQDFKQWTGEDVKVTDYSKCIQIVKRLHQIHPQLKPANVCRAIESFKRLVQPFVNVPKPVTMDKFGRAIGVGRRKASVARAWVVEGTGEVQINGKTLAEYFGRIHDRESAVWALAATSRLDKYNVWALVEGGGTTGQAEALTLAIAKGLVVHEPALKTPLRKAGCITRDPRRVERKKTGHVKARKMPTWVKR